MILVDSSVWIDFFRGRHSAETERLEALGNVDVMGVGDLILVEVLQGFRHDRDFHQAHQVMATFPLVTIGGPKIALQAARNYRSLRARGVTVRKTIDSLIATHCIEHSARLLYADRDYDPFVEHLGLMRA